MRRPWLAAGLCLALLSGCAGSPVPTAEAPVPVPVSAETVPVEGDRVTGSGWVVQVRHHPAAQLCAPASFGGRPVPGPCAGVALLGVDLSRLQDLQERDGEVGGWATITGTWRDGAAQVDEQAPLPAPDDPTYADPPCPAPPGGWPHGRPGDTLAAELAALRAAFGLSYLRVPERMTQLHVSPTQTLLGWTVPDEAARLQAERDLPPLVRVRSCVVVARHTDEEVLAARAASERWWSELRVQARFEKRDLQPVVHVDTEVLTDALLARAAEHPEGLVVLRPLLRVVARPPRGAATPEPAAADPRLAVDGSRVTATGRREDVGGRTRLCSPLVLGWGRASGDEQPCSQGVEVEGLDASTGLLTVTGTLRGEVLVVERAEPVPVQPWSSGLPEVPCAPPPGGWPDGGAPYDDRSPDDAVMGRLATTYGDLSRDGRLMLLRPARDRQVVTVIARDEAERSRMQAVLEPHFGARTCVVVQDHDLDLSTRALHDHRLQTEGMQISGTTEFGPGLRTRAAHVGVLRLTPLLLETQASYPPGVLVLEPFLRVVEEPRG